MLYELIFIINVEIPDMEADKLGGKKTAIVTYGRQYGFIIGTIAASMATVSFIFMPSINLNIPPINWGLLVVFSLVPLGFGILSTIKTPINRKSAIKWVNYNLLSLSIFIIMINTYFIYLI
jgi:1,4-dihydroxy-2-naphthoate polyprenyltransferase